MPIAPPALTLITDTHRLHKDALLEALAAGLRGGADAVLVREKAMDSARLLAFAAEVRQLTRSFQARLIIHSQLDVALAVDADGLHLAAVEIGHLPRVRTWLNGAQMSVSVSCHNAEELAQAADAGADFATLSPLFTTRSHPDAVPLGVDRFKALAESAAQSHQLPVVALGGIHSENAAPLAGWPLAVIDGVLAADDPQAAAAALRRVATSS